MLCLISFKSRLSRAAIVLTLAVLLSSSTVLPTAHASAGDLDPNFGSGGKVTTDFGATLLSGAFINDVAIQPDGKIIAVGIFHKTDFDRDIAIARYKNDGSPDRSFGTRGRVVTDLGLTQADSFSQSVTIQSDGKILIAVSGGPVFTITLARYNNDGSLDQTFGSGGLLKTDIRGTALQRLVIQPDGKIVVPGVSLNGFFTDFVVARYNPDGRADLTFGTGGKVITDFNGFSDSPSSILLQSDGKILVGGRGGSPDFGSDFVIARYESNGVPDLAFGAAGKVSTDFFRGEDGILNLNVTPDGKIIAAGVAARPGEFVGPLALARYDADGIPDSTFSVAGKATGPVINSFTPPRAIAFQPDGKIVAAAISFTNFQDFGVTRYNSDATIDLNFGSGGIASTDFAGNLESASAIAIQSDGKIIVGGAAHVGLNSQFALVRYQTSLRITSASVSGKTLSVFGENFDSGAVILLNGKKQKTANDEQQPNTILIGKKAGKKISPGEEVIIQIRNSDGALSQVFSFTRPTE